MPAPRCWSCRLFVIAMLASGSACAAGGAFGIDHRLHYDNSGIWKRSNQDVLMYGTIATVAGGGLAFGDHDRLGDTFWRSVDALVISSASSEALKYAFRRERSSQTADPDRFFAGRHAQSFPGGEMAALSAAVTPFIAEYGQDHPAVYALALLPAYDAMRGSRSAVAGKATRGWLRRSVSASACVRPTHLAVDRQ